MESGKCSLSPLEYNDTKQKYPKIGRDQCYLAYFVEIWHAGNVGDGDSKIALLQFQNKFEKLH